MRLTFRLKLLLITGVALFALFGVLGASAWIGVYQTEQLADVERRIVPKLEAGPRLAHEFERLSRALQDAVAANDVAALEATAGQRRVVFDVIGTIDPAIDPTEAAALRWAIQDYYDSAHDISERLIAGETGEQLVADAARMQKLQADAGALIQKSTFLSKNEVSDAFRGLRRAQENADRLRIALGLLGLLLVGFLSWSIGRSMLRGLGQLSSGFARFATGDFTREIPITTNDELSDVSKEANQMASSLRHLAEQRDQHDWLKAGQVGLSDELRGELSPAEVGKRSLAFLAGYLDALAAALYLKADDGSLKLGGCYAVRAGSSAEAAGVIDAARAFREGEGLVGELFASGDVRVIEDPPSGYLRIESGLGAAEPKVLVLVLLVHQDRKLGVLEFAFLKPCQEGVLELLKSVRPTLVIALEGAESRAAQQRLLWETQVQAQRLAAQEEELRASNQELMSQQEELRRANEELEQQREALRNQNEELEQARLRVHEKAEELVKVSTYKSQFLANMSHELRTPLNSMLLLSHLLSENESGNLTGKQVEQLKTVHSAGQDLLALINQVLDLSKIEAGRQDVDLELVDLQHFVTHIGRRFEPLARDKGLAFACEIEAGAPRTMTTDRQRVERILTNLVGNAIKFTEQGGVSLRIGRPASGLALQNEALSPDSSIAFSVSDTGAGIAPEHQERVFSPFEQLEPRTNHQQAGTGLGLAIARESTLLLGGELVLRSAPGEGSSFVCVVPEKPVSGRATESTPQVHEIGDNQETLISGESHLLIIEDDPVLAEQLVGIIHTRDLKVVVAETGKGGLVLARERRPIGIILDVKLPDVDGWTVMDLLQRDPTTRSIPVHFISGVDAPQRGLSMGAVGYLVKPATHAELAAVVRTLAPAKAESQRVLVVEDDAVEAQSVVHLLQKEGFETEHVLSAEGAIQALSKHDYGCMILDLGLPDMDGLGLLQTLRERLDLGAPRVVVHTGRALTKQETRQLEEYSEAVVLKDGSSAQRLLEEVRLFVRHVKENLAPSQRSIPVPSKADLSLDGIKLLVAEDDMRTVYALSALLHGKGATVVVADTGREALDALERNPDTRCVLMDLMMPEMDGYEAMRRLRRDERFASLPVIALTAKAMKGERERCLEAGASEYLTKPIDSEKLLSTLKTWIGRDGANGGK